MSTPDAPPGRDPLTVAAAAAWLGAVREKLPGRFYVVAEVLATRARGDLSVRTDRAEWQSHMMRPVYAARFGAFREYVDAFTREGFLRQQHIGLHTLTMPADVATRAGGR